MGLISYKGEDKEITFKCNKCERNGDDPMRTISEADMELVSGGGFAGVALPLCSCGTKSYILPGQELKGPITHLRAVLFRRLYEAAGGDGNPDLAAHKIFIDALKASYDELATDEAKNQLKGKSNFANADKTVKPLKKEKPQSDEQ